VHRVQFIDGEMKAVQRPRLESRGLGDTIARGIHAASGGRIKPCGGCRKRQDFGNKVLPYKRVPKMNGRR
jgi:hypothetical protein